jgi:thiol-disulfide isomerase/thioredoxin
MVDLSQLKWTNIVSPAMDPNEYLRRFTEKPQITKNYNDYNPRKLSIDQIKNNLINSKKGLNILVIGAIWCPDCTMEVPKMVKICEILGDLVNFRILYGVMVDPYNKKNRVRWAANHSPPEAVDPIFDLTKIPIFYLFTKDGKYINRIIEHPKYTKSLEEEILIFLHPSEKNDLGNHPDQLF